MLIATAWLALATSGRAATPATTAAAEVPYELQWVREPGAESCSGARELATAVNAWLGRQAIDGAGGDAMVIDGHIAPTAGGWKVSIAIRDPDGTPAGTRELELAGADCRAIDESVVLVLGLIIDPDATGPALPADPVEVAPVVAPPARRWRGEATAGGAAGAGVLPGVAVGARFAVGLDAPRMWPVAIGLDWWAGGELRAGTDQQVSLDRWQASAMLSTPAWRPGRVRLSLAAGGAVARIAARGLGFDRDLVARATVGLASVAGRAAVDLGPTAFVAADVRGEVPFTRPRFREGDGTQVYRVAVASIVAGMAVGVRF